LVGCVNFISDPERDAWATIAGFVYQVDLTILRWLNLDDNEWLELECGEDIDTVRQELEMDSPQDSRLLEQVKRRKANITLRSSVALVAMANFCIHRATNPNIRLRFRFVTTAETGREMDW
jgi:hypothetical protein